LSIPENPENLRSRSGSDLLQNGSGSIQDDLERSAGRVQRAGGSALAEVGTRPEPEKQNQLIFIKSMKYKTNYIRKDIQSLLITRSFKRLLIRPNLN
jgi:hypothetical protein